MEVVNGEFASVEFRSYLVQRQDNAYGGTIEYRPEGAVESVFFSSIYSEFIDDELRNQFNFEFDAAGEAFVMTGGNGVDTFTGTVAPGETVTDPFIGVTRLLQDGRYKNSTFTNTAGLDFTFNDWFVETRLNYTETENDVNLLLPFSTFAITGGVIGFEDVENPTLDLFDPLANAFAGEIVPWTISDVGFNFDLFLPAVQTLDIEAFSLKGDASREGQWFGHDATFKAGLKFDRRDASGHDIHFKQVFGINGVDFDSFNTGLPWPSDFNNTIGGTLYDNVGAVQALRDAGVDFSLTIPENLRIEIEESIYAAYTMASTDFDWGNLILGARIEATEFEASGASVLTVLDDEGDPVGDPTITPITASNDYVHVLPSAHLNFDLSENQKLRFSLTTGVSRPTYIESRASIAPALPLDGVPSVSGGNPNLDAEFSWGGDASYEWYFDTASLFSAAVFARSIDNVIYAESNRVDDISVLAPGLSAEPGDYVSFFNGEDGQLYGVELNFIGQASSLVDGPLGGFGIEASATFLDSEFTIPSNGERSARTIDLPGTSDTILGASLFYENYGLSARVSYQYRSKWLDETESNGDDQFWDAQERVDASVRYALPHDFAGASVTLFVDGNNLTDEVDVRYTNVPATPNQVEGYGRRWLAGFRIDY